MKLKCIFCNNIHFKNELCGDYKCNGLLTIIIKKYKKIKISNYMEELKNIKNYERYKCDVCEKVFTVKHNYLYHIEKEVCKRKIFFKCDKCGKKFTEKKNLTYHQNKSVCKKNNIINIINNTQNTQNTQNIGNQTINTQNIFIAVANSSDLKKVVDLIPFRNATYNITPEKYLEYANNPEQAIKKFIKDQHFNPNKPERMNILNTNARSNRVQIFDRDDDNICRWMTKDKATVSELLYDRGVNHLFVAKDIIEANGMYLDPRKEINLKEKINEYETDPKIKKQYIGMISDLSYDYHNMIEENRKVSSLDSIEYLKNDLH